eukprot:TRINITY_DN26313_c0_g1_i1.p1 TRINITY_DN26313_c0_g1~~TRINITY_DN26313_c0_g1_i1.p1  ORF type:complete len:639 (-),score=108.97 TRINITY_DN26313_c0_g1_i1:613-2529(-)
MSKLKRRAHGIEHTVSAAQPTESASVSVSEEPSIFSFEARKLRKGASDRANGSRSQLKQKPPYEAAPKHTGKTPISIATGSDHGESLKSADQKKANGLTKTKPTLTAAKKRIDKLVATDYLDDFPADAKVAFEADTWQRRVGHDGAELRDHKDADHAHTELGHHVSHNQMSDSGVVKARVSEGGVGGEGQQTGLSNESNRFEDLGLSEELCSLCQQLGMRTPTPVQQACIPAILSGRNVVGIAQTGSGKTAAFALPILEKLCQDPYGVFALVLTPTRELAMQIAEQFRALGSGMNLRDAVVIGGVEMTAQAQRLAARPHVVVATPGRLRDQLASDPGMAKVFARVQFLVMDEADRLLEASFEDELGGILAAMPARRQTLLFSATMTDNLEALQQLEMGGGQSKEGQGVFTYEAYAGFQTVELLRQEYLFIPANVKDVYLFHVLGKVEEMKVRSLIVFSATCRACQLLHLTLQELGIASVALHSLQSQGRRLAALARFRTGQVPLLLATDVASRGLDIPSVDLVVNYDMPRFTRDYVHRVGRTARAGRGGLALSMVTQYDVELLHSIEALIGRQLVEHTVVEDEVLKRITKVFKAKRAALLQLSETGFDELVKTRREMNHTKRQTEGTRGRKRKSAKAP